MEDIQENPEDKEEIKEKTK